MRKNMVLLFMIAVVGGCMTEKKEKSDLAELLQIRESIEKGSSFTIRKYQDMLDNSGAPLKDIESDPEFQEMKSKALADVNDLIIKALENEADKTKLLDCIKTNGADSPLCEQQMKQAMATAEPRMQQLGADLGKFIANKLHQNNSLPQMENNNNCNAIHNGTFLLFIEADTMSITRDDNYQIEKFRGETRKEKVTWIGDCAYRLQLIKEESILTGENMGAFMDDTFIEIIRVTDSFYMYKIFESEDNQMGDLIDIGKVFRK